MKNLKNIAAVTALSLSSLSSMAAVTGFSGDYASGQWTEVIDTAGSVNTSGAPNYIILTGSDGGNGNDFGVSSQVDFTIASPITGIVSFNWSYDNSDLPQYDKFGYILNDNFYNLVIFKASNWNSNSGAYYDAGSAEFSVKAGDVFGFRLSSDESAGPAVVTISSFSASAPAPVPAPLPILGAVAAIGWSRKLRRRIRESQALAA